MGDQANAMPAADDDATIVGREAQPDEAGWRQPAGSLLRTTALESRKACHADGLPHRAGVSSGGEAAFHDVKGESGTCIDCHKKENASGKEAPLKCQECHKKA